MQAEIVSEGCFFTGSTESTQDLLANVTQGEAGEISHKKTVQTN